MSIVYDTPENKKLRGLIKSLRAESLAKDTELTQLKADLQGYHDNAKALDEKDRYWQGVAKKEKKRAVKRIKDLEAGIWKEARLMLDSLHPQRCIDMECSCAIGDMQELFRDRAAALRTPEEGADQGGGK